MDLELLELSGEGIYGTQVFGDKSYSWAFFFNIAASNGVRYFTEDMEPLINSPEAVRALEIYKEMKELSPPGAENFGGDETIGNWQQGKVVNKGRRQPRQFTPHTQGVK